MGVILWVIPKEILTMMKFCWSIFEVNYDSYDIQHYVKNINYFIDTEINYEVFLAKYKFTKLFTAY